MTTKRNTLFFCVAAVAVVVLFVCDLLFGSTSLAVSDVWGALVGGGESEVAVIVRKFRLPKAVVAVLCGAALGASGLQMQTLFRNPLAGPYVLGISSGASLGVALFLMGAPLLGIGTVAFNLGMAGAAWIGAALIFLLIVSVSRRVKDIMVVLILGVMFGSVASAAVEIMQYFSTESSVKSYVVWTMGSLGNVTSAQLVIMAPVVVAGLVMSVATIKPLNAMMLGEQYAATMGVNVRRSRLAILVSTTLLAGTVTAFCGPIGFVGLAVPHVVRMATGRADHRVLMPGTILVGAAVMLLCDILSKMPSSELTLPINTVTALLGIPIIIVVIVKGRNLF
ncbi:MAG: iron ABC transporter permease [Rikenellaceae bacterium]|nr:iron ABC transporter permease [Rikenellaceae bacterium]